MTVDEDVQMIAINGFDDSDDDCVLFTHPPVVPASPVLVPGSPVVVPALPPTAFPTSQHAAPAAAPAGPANLWYAQQIKAPANPALSDSDDDSVLAEAKQSNGMLPAMKGCQKKATKDGKGKMQRMRNNYFTFTKGAKSKEAKH